MAYANTDQAAVHLWGLTSTCRSLPVWAERTKTCWGRSIFPSLFGQKGAISVPKKTSNGAAESAMPHCLNKPRRRFRQAVSLGGRKTGRLA